MKKIMFNDKYGLTDAVLKGRKTMTRRMCREFRTLRIIKANEVESVGGYSDENLVEFVMKDGSVKVSVPSYKVGEVVAVAQRYSDLAWDTRLYKEIKSLCPGVLPWHELKGWDNKMFVKADLMPHQIRITDIKVERLQDISDEDAMLEGIKKSMWMDVSGKQLYGFGANEDKWVSPRDAFAALINEISGKGTWELNPYVFAYTFELVK